MTTPNMASGWEVYAQHVMPLDDLHPHVSVPNCWCHPTEDDGVYVHHSADRREEYEHERKPS